MDKYSAIFRSLSPAGEPGLEKDDPTWGMNQPTLEGNVHSPNPGPDRPKPELQEQTMENYGDDVPSLEKELARQRELSRIPIGDVVVIPSPSRVASGDEMSESIYSKIVSALKRIAATGTAPDDEDPEPFTAEMPAEPTTSYSQSAPPAGETTQERVDAETEEARRLYEERKRKQREEEEKKLEEEKGKLGERTRQKGPKKDLSDAKFVDVGEGSKLYEQVLPLCEKLMSIKADMVEALDKFVTLSEVTFRYTNLLKNATEDIRKVKKEYEESARGQMALVTPHTDELLLVTDIVNKINLDDGVNRVISKKNQFDSVSLEMLQRILTDEKYAAEVISKVRGDVSPRKEGPVRAETMEKMLKEEKGDLIKGLELMKNEVKKSADKVMAAEAKIVDFMVAMAPGADKLFNRLKEVKARADKYGQDISNIAEKYAISKEDLDVEKSKLAYYLSKLGMGMKFASGFSSSASKEASLSTIKRIAEQSWKDAVSDINEINSDIDSAFKEFGMKEKMAELAKILTPLSEAMPEMMAALDKVDPLGNTLETAAAAAGAPAPAQEAPQASTETQQQEPEMSLMERIRQSLTPGPAMEPSFAGAAAAQESDLDRVAKKKKKDSKSETVPLGLDIPGGEALSDEELKKQYVSPEGLGKAEKDLYLSKQRMERERTKQDTREQSPSGQEKLRKHHTQEALDKQLRDRVNPEVIKKASSAVQLASEARKQANEGIKGINKVLESALQSVSSMVEPASVGGGEYKTAIRTIRNEMEKGIAEYAKKAKEATGLHDSIVKAFNTSMPADEKIVGDAVIKIGGLYKFIVDTKRKMAFMKDPKIADKVEQSLKWILDKAVSANLADPESSHSLERSAEFLKAWSDKVFRFTTRSQRIHPQEFIDAVKKKMGPAIEKGLEVAEKGAPIMTEPLTEGTAAPAASAPEQTTTQSSSLSAMERSADVESPMGEIDSIGAELDDINKDVPEVLKAIEDIGAMLGSVVKFAESAGPKIDELISMEVPAETEPEAATPAEEEGGSMWSNTMDTLKGLMESFGPEEPVLAPIPASQETDLTRTAGEYDKFDVSKNKLEIVEGDDGKRKLVINKGLRNLVSKRVQDMLNGGYKCGDQVQVDMSDYLGLGTVKAYLGNGVYRVEVDGAVMEVPAKNVLGLDGNPWR